MSQSSLPASPPRAPGASGREAEAERSEADWERHAPLRLTVARGTLGLELYEPIEIGPLEVRALSLILPGLRFPVDLSGGVPLFRNRRGDLEHIELGASLDQLGRLLDHRLRELMGPLERRVAVWAVADGLGVGLVGQGALAFDLLWAPDAGNARFVVTNARGAGLAAPALGYALRVLDSTFGKLGRRRGRLVTIEDVGQRLGRELLPALGARAPSSDRLRFGELTVDGDAARVELDSTFPPPALSDAAARALELAELVADADDELARGEMDKARALYIAALEQAPRHPELVRLVAEIDMVAGNRAEAALGLISESLPAIRAGLVGAELLARVGDLGAAREAVSEVARDEVFGALSALYWHRLSELEPSLKTKLELLGQALSRAPGLARVRWARFARRLEQGDVTGALSDVEHLEAGAIGARARHEACRRAARSLLDSGFVRDAGWVFERALRYLPDDPVATAGLARALIETGRSDRALALLERAIQLGERKGRADPDALVDLARLLAEKLRDLPQAIARVRQVPASSERAVEARGLEARWRAALGDIVGATQAWGRLREVIELSHPADPRWAAWLVEAAGFERAQQKDVVSAERHLAVAIRIAPHDRGAGEAYREVAAVVAAQARLERQARAEAREVEVAAAPGAEPPERS